jgi:hypothetical protein
VNGSKPGYFFVEDEIAQTVGRHMVLVLEFFDHSEVFDGFSAEWGASTGDLMPMPQELLYMFRKNYCGRNNVLLQNSLFIRLNSWTDVLDRSSRKFKKDYNGQTGFRSNILFSPTLKFQNG